MGEFGVCFRKTSEALATLEPLITEFERGRNPKGYAKVKSQLVSFGIKVEELTRALYVDKPSQSEVRRRQQILLELEDKLVGYEKRLNYKPKTPATKPDLSSLPNQELMQFRERLTAQEGIIDSIENSVSSIKRTSVSIGNELDLHIHLLKRIETNVDLNNTRMQRIEKRMAVFMERSSTGCLSFTIFVLTLVLLMIIIYLC